MAYQGQIAELPIGLSGLTGNKNQSQILPTHLIVAEDITYEGGTIQKEGGATKYNSTTITGAPSVVGGWDWFPSVDVQRMVVVLSDGTIKKDSGSGDFATTLVSGLSLTINTVPMFVDGGAEAAANDRKLFIFTGGDNGVQVLSADGATVTRLDTSTDPADWNSSHPTFGLSHEGRLWGGGNANDPHRIYYSTTGDHEDFQGAGSGTLSIFPGEGTKLVGALSYKGLIIAWKFPRGIYIIDTTDPAIANWKIARLSQSVGGVSPHGAVVVDDDILFMDATGVFHFISSVQEFGSLGTRNLSVANGAAMDEFFRNEINFSGFAKLRSIFYPSKAEAHFCLPALGSTINNRRVVVDFNVERPRFRFSLRDIVISMWTREDSDGIPRPVIGDDAGFVWDLDQDSRSKDGSGYNGQFQIPHLDLGHLDPKFGTVRKMGQFLEIIAEPSGNWNLNVDIYWDNELSETVTFNMGTTGSTLGTFVLGTDKLAGDTVLNKKRRITGSGRRFSVVGRNSGDGQDFSISKMYLHFIPSDERL